MTDPKKDAPDPPPSTGATLSRSTFLRSATCVVGGALASGFAGALLMQRRVDKVNSEDNLEALARQHVEAQIAAGTLPNEPEAIRKVHEQAKENNRIPRGPNITKGTLIGLGAGAVAGVGLANALNAPPVSEEEHGNEKAGYRGGSFR